MNKVSPRPSRWREVLACFVVFVPSLFAPEVATAASLLGELTGFVVEVFGRLRLGLGALDFAGVSPVLGRLVRKAPRTSS